MAQEPSALLLRHIRNLAAGDVPDSTDAELVQRFAASGDEGAFETLLRRHGPLVLGVCRHVLRHEQDAEDAFQATFLILARKSASLWKRQSVGSWLHGVAYRVARRARAQAQRRHLRESRRAMPPAPDALADITLREAQAILDEELARLPEAYCAPLVLCCLEGESRDEAARQLGWPPNRLKSRLERARALLRGRLARRGLTLSLPLLAAALGQRSAAEGLPAGLVRPTVAAARLLAGAAPLPAGLVSEPVADLVKQGLREALLNKVGVAAIALLTLGIAAAGAGLAARPTPPAEAAAERQGAARPEAGGEGAPPRQADEPLPPGARVRLGSPWFRVGGHVTSLTFAADGGTILAANHDLVVARRDVVTDRVVTEFKGHTSNVVAVALSPDGSLLASGGADKTVRVWRMKTGAQVWAATGHKLMIETVAFSPDGKTLASGGDQTVRLWDVAKGQEVRQLPVQGRWSLSVAFSPDGKTLAVAGDGGIDRWDVGTARKLPRLDAATPAYGYHSVAFSPDGGALAAGTRGQTVEVWDAATGKSRWRKALGDGHRFTSFAVVFSPDGTALAAGGADGTVRLCNPATGEETRRLEPLQGCLAALAFSPDGKVLASGGEGSIRFWDPATGREHRPDRGHRGLVEALAFSPDGRTLASAGRDRTIRLWDPTTGNQRRLLPGHRDTVQALAFSADGQTLATGGAPGDPTVRVWDLSTGEQRALIRPQLGGVSSLAFSPDGKTLAAGGTRTIQLFNASTGQASRQWEGHDHEVTGLAFSPDGTALASASYDRTAALWDVAGGAERQRLRGHEGYVAAVAFRPDGRLLATAGWDRTVRFWDAAKGAEVGRLSGGRYGLSRLAFSPDGRWLAVAGHSGRVHLWEVATGQELLGLPAAAGFALAFSPDGRTVATGQRDGTILLWDVAGAVLGEPHQAGRLGPQELEAVGMDLAGADARRAYRAAGRLLAAPQQAVSLLEARLRPGPPDPARQKEVVRLIAELDADDFAAREKAGARLEELGGLAEPALRKALEGEPVPEVRRRVGRLLDRLSPPPLAPLPTAQLRALTVLEYLGTPEARQALLRLAEAEAGSPLGSETKAAAGRLTRRGAPR